jgi:hypothetical protein
MRTREHYDYLKDFIPDSLIESKEIVKFKRSKGWVTIGLDPIRENNRYGLFKGTDRISIDNSMFVRGKQGIINDLSAGV